MNAELPSNVCPLLSQPSHVVTCLTTKCALYVAIIDDGKPAGGHCALHQIPVQINGLMQLLDRFSPTPTGDA